MKIKRKDDVGGRPLVVTPEIVKAIQASTDKQDAVAFEYGISQATVSRIRNGVYLQRRAA